MLSERKRKILQAVVGENIKNAEPISSKVIQERFFSDLSSATIRNDLMNLEEMGYLFQPHTSSGRVPTAEGFKKYIEELMPERELSSHEIMSLKKGFDEKISGIEDLAKITASAISDATSYASVVYMGALSEAIIESIKIVKILPTSCLVVVVTDLGIIKDLMIETDEDITEEDCLSASRLLTDLLHDRLIVDLSGEEVTHELSMVATRWRKMFDMVIEAIQNRSEKEIVEMDGASNLLSQPEYSSKEKMSQMIKLFETKDVLAPLLSTGNDLEISFHVGSDELNGCSVVSANYKINGKNVGKAGVIGPVRMDYAKAVSVLKEVSQTIQEQFGNSKKGIQNNKQNKYISRRKEQKNERKSPK